MFDLGNGHTIKVEKANRGFEDDYKITFYEDGRMLGSEYGNTGKTYHFSNLTNKLEVVD